MTFNGDVGFLRGRPLKKASHASLEGGMEPPRGGGFNTRRLGVPGAGRPGGDGAGTGTGRPGRRDCCLPKFREPWGFEPEPVPLLLRPGRSVGRLSSREPCHYRRGSDFGNSKSRAEGEVSRVTALPAETSFPHEPAAVNTPVALPLTLEQAISTGLEQNPTLVSLRATQQVADAALGVAKTYPFNPLVQVEVCPIDHELGTGQGATLNYVYLLQTLEFATSSVIARRVPRPPGIRCAGTSSMPSSPTRP